MPSTYTYQTQDDILKKQQQAAAAAAAAQQTAQAQSAAYQSAAAAPAVQTTNAGAGTAGGYTPSEAVISARNYLEQQIASKPGAYTSKYTDQLESILNQIQNRDPFVYDASADPLYNIYKDLYIQNGRRAMMDTIGNAAALTGGYGNSYAQSAGQQMYNQYMEALNARVPELQQQAYQRYSDEGDRMVQSWQMYNTLENQNFNQYRATVSDWQTERALAQQLALQTWQLDMNRYQYDTDAAYRQAQADLAASQWERQFAENIRQYDNDAAYRQAQADLAADQWERQFAEDQRLNDRAYDYQLSRDAVSDEQWLKNYEQNVLNANRDYELNNASLAEKQRQFDIVQALEQAKFDLTYQKYLDELAAAGSGGSGGNGGQQKTQQTVTPAQTTQTSGTGILPSQALGTAQIAAPVSVQSIVNATDADTLQQLQKMAANDKRVTADDLTKAAAIIAQNSDATEKTKDAVKQYTQALNALDLLNTQNETWNNMVYSAMKSGTATNASKKKKNETDEWLSVYGK